MPEITRTSTPDDKDIKKIISEEEKKENSETNINNSKVVEAKEPNIFQRTFQRVKNFFKEIGKTVRDVSASVINRIVLGNENYRKQVNRDYVEARKNGMEGMFKVPEKDELVDKILVSEKDTDIDIKKLGQEVEEYINPSNYYEVTAENGKELQKMFNKAVDDITNDDNLNGVTIHYGEDRVLFLEKDNNSAYAVRIIGPDVNSEGYFASKEELEEYRDALNERKQSKETETPVVENPAVKNPNIGIEYETPSNSEEPKELKDGIPDVSSKTTEKTVGSFIENEGMMNEAIAEHEAEITTINCYNKEAFDRTISRASEYGLSADVRLVDSPFRAEIREGNTHLYMDAKEIKTVVVKDKYTAKHDEKNFNKVLASISNEYNNSQRTGPINVSFGNKDIAIIPQDTSIAISVVDIENIKVHEQVFEKGDTASCTSFMKNPEKYELENSIEEIPDEDNVSSIKKTLDEIIEDAGEEQKRMNQLENEYPNQDVRGQDPQDVEDTLGL